MKVERPTNLSNEDPGTFMWENPNKQVAETCRMIALSKSLKKFGVKHLDMRFLLIYGGLIFWLGVAIGMLIVAVGIQWNV